MIIMSKYTSIPVSRRTKKILEIEKGDKNWDEFLLLLVKIKREYEAREVVKRIKARLMKSEEYIRKSEEELRRGLKLKELS